MHLGRHRVLCARLIITTASRENGVGEVGWNAGDPAYKILGPEVLRHEEIYLREL